MSSAIVELRWDSPPGLDLDALADYLDAQRPGLVRRPLRAGLIAGGRSNLTYEVVDADGGALIVRRPPLGHVLATAHDMAREHRVISALAGTVVPVPRPLVICLDSAVLGAPFYVMSKVQGVVYRTRADLEAVGPQRGEVICSRMIDTLAQLHSIEPEAVGLADFGRPAGYLHRQVERWHRQIEQSSTRVLPGIDELYERLAHSVPAESRSAIVHGDFRLDNLLVGDGDCVAAVLDWEMATLGDPLMDLAVLVAYTEEAQHSPRTRHDSAATAAAFPSSDQLIARYCEQTGRPLRPLAFHLGLAYFKLVGILEGIHYRHVTGQTLGDGFDGVGARVPWLIAAGLAAVTT